MKNNNRDSSGFTLLEVLVALTIFAVVSVMAYRQVAASIYAAERILDKNVALWVAENTLESYFLSRQVTSTGSSDSTVSMAGSDWHVRVTVESTSVKDFYKLEARVAPEHARGDESTITVTRYLGKH